MENPKIVERIFPKLSPYLTYPSPRPGHSSTWYVLDENSPVGYRAVSGWYCGFVDIRRGYPEPIGWRSKENLACIATYIKVGRVTKVQVYARYIEAFTTVKEAKRKGFTLISKVLKYKTAELKKEQKALEMVERKLYPRRFKDEPTRSTRSRRVQPSGYVSKLFNQYE